MQIRLRHLFLGVSAAIILHLGMASLFIDRTPSIDNKRYSSAPDGLTISLHSIQKKEKESISAFEPELDKVDASLDRNKIENDLEKVKASVPSESQYRNADISGREEHRKKDAVTGSSSVQTEPSVKVPLEPKKNSRSSENNVPAEKVVNNDSKIKPPDVNNPADDDKNIKATTYNNAGLPNGKTSSTEKVPDPLNTDAVNHKKDEYFGVLRNWLEIHKKYPRRARMRRQEGVVVLRFVLGEQGNVIDYQIEDSSGFQALDQEVERMIQAADPLPKIPSELKQSKLELVIPIRFSLR